jgi:hypothetical protein
MLDINKKP